MKKKKVLNSSYFQNEAIQREESNSKYCRFKKFGIKYIDYKEVGFLMSFLNPQGKILPRRITGTSQKYQKKVSKAVKKARQVALLPYVVDNLK